MNLLIINSQSQYIIPRSFLIKKIKTISTKLLQENKKKRISQLLDSQFKNLTLTLVFVDAKDIKSLNKNFRNKNRPTDVLSFESQDPEALGELVFCPEIIVSNAKDNHWSQRDEYLYMMVHGVLHLLGFDHMNDLDAKKMFTLQDRLFNAVSTHAQILID